MAKNTPAFQFYPTDFLGGVGLLSDEAVGIYVKLLSALWVQGNRLPFCFDKMARVAMTSPAAIKKVWPEIESKFVIENDEVSHPRFSRMMELAEIRRGAGSKGGKQTAKQNSSKTGSKPPSKSGSKTPANTRRTKYEERRLKNENLEAEDWVFPDGWNTPELREALDGFAEMRDRIGKPIRSKISTSKSFKRFDGPEHLAYAAEHCEANDYQGLKPDYRPPTGGQHGRTPMTFAQQKAKNTVDAATNFVERRRQSTAPAIEGPAQ